MIHQLEIIEKESTYYDEANKVVIETKEGDVIRVYAWFDDIAISCPINNGIPEMASCFKDWLECAEISVKFPETFRTREVAEEISMYFVYNLPRIKEIIAKSLLADRSPEIELEHPPKPGKRAVF